MFDEDDTSPRRWRVALTAHETKKDALAAFVRRHAAAIRDWDLIATAGTGERLQAVPGLRIRTTLPGRRGGHLQLAAGIAAGEIDGMIFLRDPLVATGPEPDVAGLLRLADIHNVALATNLASAECLVRALAPEIALTVRG